MWQRFTERARRIVFFAQQEAGRLGTNLVDTEHLLAGLLQEHDNLGTRVLDKLGFSAEMVRDALTTQNVLPREEGSDGATPGTDMQLTHRAKRVIDLAYDEARSLNNNYIGTEHILLGLIREGEGMAGRKLLEMGVELEAVRVEVRRIQSENLGNTPADQHQMWTRFTERASRLVSLAQEEAYLLGDKYVRTEHLLLGLLREPDTAGAKVLVGQGVSLDDLRGKITAMLARGDALSVRDIQLSPRAKNVIDLSYDEARQMNNNFIGTEHILLGLIREGEGAAGLVLKSAGVDLEAVREEARRIQNAMEQEAGDSSSPYRSRDVPVERGVAPIVRPGDLGLLRVPPAPEGSEPMNAVPQPVALFVDTPELLPRIREMVEVRDAYRFAEFLRSGAVIYVASDTQAKRLKHAEDKESELFYVRLLNGEREGQTFWVSENCFQRTGADTRPFPPAPDDLPTLDGESVESLLERALARNASALALMTGQPPLILIEEESVQRLVRLEDSPITHPEILRLLTDLLTADQYATFQGGEKVAFDYLLHGRTSFRVTCYRDGYALAAYLVRESAS